MGVQTSKVNSVSEGLNFKRILFVCLFDDDDDNDNDNNNNTSIQFFICLRLELNSQWPITDDLIIIRFNPLFIYVLNSTTNGQ
jgi:hypothetical protein